MPLSNQVRTMLSESLRAVVSQKLIPRADGPGRVAALETLVVNRPVGNLIRENKTFQIHSVLQTGGAHGMQLFDHAIARLASDGLISQEEAMKHSSSPKGAGS